VFPMTRVGRIAERMQILDREIGNSRLAGLSRQRGKVDRAWLRGSHSEGEAEQKQRQNDSRDIIMAAHRISFGGDRNGMAMVPSG
jgi:hypothetical protein